MSISSTSSSHSCPLSHMPMRRVLFFVPLPAVDPVAYQQALRALYSLVNACRLSCPTDIRMVRRQPYGCNIATTGLYGLFAIAHDDALAAEIDAVPPPYRFYSSRPSEMLRAYYHAWVEAQPVPIGPAPGLVLVDDTHVYRCAVLQQLRETMLPPGSVTSFAQGGL